LARLLEARRAADTITGLVIDEAQAIPDELLEEVRLLANIETATDKLLPIVLSGQPEIAERLNKPSLRQLKQRIALRCELGALDARETAEYVAGRIRIAGGNSTMVFTRQSVDLIFERSGGIPRLISVICDNALISGFAADRRPVSRDIIEEVCRDFDLLPAGTDGSCLPAAKERVERQPLALRQPSDPAPPALAGASAKKQPEIVPKGLFEHFTVRRRFSLF
jgi:general secretion pathway protein A